MYHGCPEIVFYSSPPVHGTLRRYHVHPEAWLHKLPDSISFEEGALLEPLSVALAGIDRMGLRMGQSLVICGAGPIGLVSLLAAHAAGAAPIAIIDIDDGRLEMAKSLVPRVRTVWVQKTDEPETVGGKIKEALGREAALAMECTGVQSSIHSAIFVGLMNCQHCLAADQSLPRQPGSAAKSTSSESGRIIKRSHSCTHRSGRSTSASSSDTGRLIRRQSCWCRSR